MKLTFVEELEVEDFVINIAINLEKQVATIVVTYTCPNCMGYGCKRSNSPCNNGSILMNLDPDKIDVILDKDSASKLRSIVQNLLLSITEKNERS